jgi:excisionase family DNA binding protein
MKPDHRDVDQVLSEPLLTAKQAGVLLGDIPASSVLGYARDGKLPHVRIGRHVRFTRADLAAHILERRFAAVR